MKKNQDQEQFQQHCERWICDLYKERAEKLSEQQTHSTIRELLKHFHLRLCLLEGEARPELDCRPRQ